MRLMKWEIAASFLLAMTLSILLSPSYSKAQEGGMVNWKFNAKKISADVLEFSAKATVASGWHIYAQDSGEGSMPTAFTFGKNPLVMLEGKVSEQGLLKKSRNEVMDSELKYYEDSVVFVQKVKILRKAQDDKGGASVLKGKVEFMVCNDAMCLPPEEVEFSVELK